MTVELERLEVKFATAGEASPDDLEFYQRTAGNLRRLLESIGLRRRARDVTPRRNSSRQCMLSPQRASHRQIKFRRLAVRSNGRRQRLSPVVAARDTKWKPKKKPPPERGGSNPAVTNGDQDALVIAFLMPAWNGSTASVVTF
jgi:hypothetical protein